MQQDSPANHNLRYNQKMDLYAVIPFQASPTGLGDDEREQLRLLIEIKMEQLGRISGLKYGLFTSCVELLADAAKFGWPILERPVDEVSSGDVEEAIEIAFRNSGASEIAWVSLYTDLFDETHMQAMLAYWATLPVETKSHSLFATATVHGYAFLGGHPVNFDSEEFNLSSRDVLPIQITNLPFTVLTKSLGGVSYRLLDDKSSMFEIPLYAFQRKTLSILDHNTVTSKAPFDSP